MATWQYYSLTSRAYVIWAAVAIESTVWEPDTTCLCHKDRCNNILTAWQLDSITTWHHMPMLIRQLWRYSMAAWHHVYMLYYKNRYNNILTARQHDSIATWHHIPILIRQLHPPSFTPCVYVIWTVVSPQLDCMTLRAYVTRTDITIYIDSLTPWHNVHSHEPDHVIHSYHPYTGRGGWIDRAWASHVGDRGFKRWSS